MKWLSKEWKDEVYEALTSDTERGAELNYELFGDNEWSGIDRAKYLEELKDKIDADSWNGGA